VNVSVALEVLVSAASGLGLRMLLTADITAKVVFCVHPLFGKPSVQLAANVNNWGAYNVKAEIFAVTFNSATVLVLFARLPTFLTHCTCVVLTLVKPLPALHAVRFITP
jgi:hypothetical protein